MVNTKTLVSILVTASVCILLMWPSSGGGQSVVQLPEYVIKDQNGAVVGSYSASSTAGSTAVMLFDSANNQRFQILVGTQFLRGSDSSDVWYTNANCTGTPYVQSPTIFATIPGLRGSVYAVGADPGGTLDNRIVRGTTLNLGNNDAVINSRFRTNVANGPTCSNVDPGVDTVEAVEVMDLSGFVRPFVAE